MKIIFLQFGRFNITSYGNGTAYSVIDTFTKEHFMVQGDSAIQFHDECESDSWENICNEYMYKLGEIL
jgi:hypothetical protein